MLPFAGILAGPLAKQNKTLPASALCVRLFARTTTGYYVKPWSGHPDAAWVGLHPPTKSSPKPGS